MLDISFDKVKKITTSIIHNSTGQDRFWRTMIIECEDGSKTEISMWSDEQNNLIPEKEE